MNQEKIGKFIATSRKMKNMTQKELAEKLGVTDRAISNWENGKNMPDLVLFKDLCNILEITINDLLSGEKIDNNSYREKFQENVTNMVVCSNKKSWRKIILIISTFSLVLLVIILGNLYFINKKEITKSDDNESLAYNYSVRTIERYIKYYFIHKMPKEFVKENGEVLNVTNMAVVETFFVEERDEKEICVYLWAVVGSFSIGEGNKVTSKPYKLTLREIDEEIYEVIDEETLMDDSNVVVGLSSADYFELRKFVNEHFSDRAQALFYDFYFSKKILIWFMIIGIW